MLIAFCVLLILAVGAALYFFTVRHRTRRKLSHLRYTLELIGWLSILTPVFLFVICTALL